MVVTKFEIIAKGKRRGGSNELLTIRALSPRIPLLADAARKNRGIIIK
jgi:hypothetical protein